MKEIITAPHAPAALGPYSHAVAAGGLLFTSGQIGLDPDTNKLPGTVEEQALQALENLKHILATAGCGLEDVVKTTVFVKNMGDFAKVNAVYGQVFGGAFPARSCVEVAALPSGALVEVEAIALRP